VSRSNSRELITSRFSLPRNWTRNIPETTITMINKKSQKFKLIPNFLVRFNNR